MWLKCNISLQTEISQLLRTTPNVKSVKTKTFAHINQLLFVLGKNWLSDAAYLKFKFFSVASQYGQSGLFVYSNELYRLRLPSRST